MPRILAYNKSEERRDRPRIIKFVWKDDSIDAFNRQIFDEHRIIEIRENVISSKSLKYRKLEITLKIYIPFIIEYIYAILL